MFETNRFSALLMIIATTIVRFLFLCFLVSQNRKCNSYKNYWITRGYSLTFHVFKMCCKPLHISSHWDTQWYVKYCLWINIRLHVVIYETILNKPQIFLKVSSCKVCITKYFGKDLKISTNLWKSKNYYNCDTNFSQNLSFVLKKVMKFEMEYILHFSVKYYNFLKVVISWKMFVKELW